MQVGNASYGAQFACWHHDCIWGGSFDLSLTWTLRKDFDVEGIRLNLELARLKQDMKREGRPATEMNLLVEPPLANQVPSGDAATDTCECELDAPTTKASESPAGVQHKYQRARPLHDRLDNRVMECLPA